MPSELPSSATPSRASPMMLPRTILPGRRGAANLDALVVAGKHVAAAGVTPPIKLPATESLMPASVLPKAAVPAALVPMKVARDRVAAHHVEDDAKVIESVDHQAANRAAASL